MFKSMTILAVLALCSTAYADTASTLSKYVGFTIAASKTVIGYRDRSGKTEDSFQGCDFDRIIRFDDGTGVRCAGYGYSYSYRPTAVILIKGSTAKMVVGSDIYDVDLNLR